MNKKSNFLKNCPGLKVWALTGGIASGKSTAKNILKEMGYFVLDADDLSKSLSTTDGLAAPEILKEFKTLNRDELKKTIFNDPLKKKKLENILHPLIQSESKRIILDYYKKNYTENKPLVVFYEASLIFETGREKDFDGVLNIHASEDIRKSRALNRDKIPPQIIDKIISQQLDDSQKRLKSDFSIENNGEVSELKHKLKQFINKLLSSL